MNQVLFIAFVALVFLAHSGTALKCYACASHPDLGPDYCNDPFNGDGGRVECRDDERRCEYISYNFPSHSSGEMVTFTARTCSTRQHRYEGAYCEKTTYDSGMYSLSCYCNTDFCNGGNMTSYPH